MKGARMTRAAERGVQVYLYGIIGEDIDAREIVTGIETAPRGALIDVFINSPGGSAYDGLAIYSALARHGRVTAHVDGSAWSAASIVAMAGDTIRMAEAGSLMIHEPWALGVGNARELRKLADQLEGLSDQLVRLYHRRTGQSESQIRAWMAGETFFTSDEAKRCGFATSIVPNKPGTMDLEPSHIAALPQRIAARYRPNRYAAIGRTVLRGVRVAR